jgi:basic membrane protein A
VDSLKQVAPQFPKTRFIHIEGDIRSNNLACFDFRSEEGGFLAGLVAGFFTRKKTAGVVTGMEIPPVEAYLTGFRAGVLTAARARREKIEVAVAPVGSFNDPVKGKSMAKALADRGADVLFRIAGNSGVGVAEAVRSTEGLYLILPDQEAALRSPEGQRRYAEAVREGLRRFLRDRAAGTP